MAGFSSTSRTAYTGSGFPGFSATGNRAAIVPSAGKPKAPTVPAQSLTNYGTPLPTQTGAVNPTISNSVGMQYAQDLPTAYTPQQMLQMKTAATNVSAAGARGTNDRLRELMAAQGLSGSGAETGALSNAMRGANANLASQMSNIDISNAQTDLSNRYQKAGLLNQLTGMGQNENQFNQGLYSDLYKWGQGFDYNKQLDTTSNRQYQDQLDMMMKMYGMGNTGLQQTIGSGRIGS
jgi:hypothetical protein